MPFKGVWLALGALFNLFAVAMGAFAAHGLKNTLDAYSLGIIQTGVQYQFVHGSALIILSLLPASRLVKASGVSFTLGILGFSGSLYLLALTGDKIWGPVTPIGGTLFLLGWACLIVKGFKK